MDWLSFYSLQLIAAHPPLGVLQVDLGPDHLRIFRRVALDSDHFGHIKKLIHQGLKNIPRLCTSRILRGEIHIIEYAPKLPFAAESEDITFIQCRDHPAFLVGLHIDMGFIRDNNEFFPCRKDQR